MRQVALIASLLATSLTGPALFAADTKADQEKRIREAGDVMREIMDTKDQAIPNDLLDRARCVGVIPNMKRAGFIVGAKYGKGVVVCRGDAGDWSAPSMVRIEGGNVGLQIGAGETDVVFVVMNQKGMDKLMEDKFTVGADASAMAGPVGRSASAQTDAMMRAEILSYSRSRGVFAGITLDGSTLRPDADDNKDLYGRAITQREILTGKLAKPAAAQSLYDVLKMYAAPQTNTPKRG